MQIDQAERGFSYLRSGPLDMRMDPSASPSAAELIAKLDAHELKELLTTYGELRRPGRVTRAILKARDDGALNSTGDLRRAVEAAIPQRDRVAELARVFQALRIAVNSELPALEKALAALPKCLGAGGRAVVISYHSLEDRRVKRFFQRESTDCVCPPDLPLCACGHKAAFELLTRRAIRPSQAEQDGNPRSRSARLRAVRRLVP